MIDTRCVRLPSCRRVAQTFGPSFSHGSKRAGLLAACLVILFFTQGLPRLATAAGTEIAKTVHNLTPEGTGKFKETQKTGLCVFCHTPHNANPQQALWNRNVSGVTYQLYSSSTLRADLNQPTGSSRLCLSCHDGLLAMGSLRTPPQGDALKLGVMSGANVLGTDLSTSHPISFVYDGALAAKHPGLVDPGSLPTSVRLDSKKQMQCTACHDPHENRRSNFLRMDTANGAMCLTCHRPEHWAESAHARSTATFRGAGAGPWASDGAGGTVAANACNNCHRTHSAGHGPRLMARSSEPDNCNVCHGGTVAQKNIAAEFASGGKFSRHPIETPQWVHDPQENPASMPRHVACEDCHNAHAANSTNASAPLVSGRLHGVTGASTAGSLITEATFEYQVCNKCHGFREPGTAGITRADSTRIVGVKIDPGSRSYHPIAAVGKNPTIKGLVPGYTASSMIGCIDCHNNSDWTPASATVAPKGPHASRFEPILEKNYATVDPSPESPLSYDLCYKCHDRNMLMRDAAGGFPHRLHSVDQRAPCAACHDAHGSRQSLHLVNFMVRDTTGKTVVTANHIGRLEYVPALPGKGSCYLTCHGSEHNPKTY
jgi:predicted CXXCH cytochrome family protein